jgi:hypothetical protein
MEWEGPERRSAESLLARELVLLKARGRRHQEELEETARHRLRRRAQLRRAIEQAGERESQILEVLGGRISAREG